MVDSAYLAKVSKLKFLTNLLFVYGSLLPDLGHPMSRWLAASADRLGEAKTSGKLVDLGEYPGLVLAEGEGKEVFGQLFRLHNPEVVLKVLDEYEGIGSDSMDEAYSRHVIPVQWAGEEINAQAYIYVGQIIGKPLVVSGDYRIYHSQMVQNQA